jgi:DNA-binding LacI/PurR family transcriptional regulator
MNGPVRLSDVAKSAGVSLGTASNVFNRPERVSLQVRERVEVAARKLGYSGPDPKGRLLMGRKANAIGVVTANPITYFFDNPSMNRFMAGVTEVCRKAGAGVALVSSLDEDEGAWGVNSALVDGFVLYCLAEPGPLVDLARRRKLPYVVVDFEVGPEVSSVCIDDRGGAREQIRHLTALGHRKIGIVSLIFCESSRKRDVTGLGLADHKRWEPADIPVTRERLAGYADGLAEAGLSIDDTPIIEAHKEPELAALGAAKLLDLAPDITAIVAMADIFALPVLAEARRRGMAVPRDLSVVGFDDDPEAATSDPPLTTIQQPGEEKGRMAAELIVGRGPVRHEVMPVRLIVRGSTAAPRRPG